MTEQLIHDGNGSESYLSSPSTKFWTVQNHFHGKDLRGWRPADVDGRKKIYIGNKSSKRKKKKNDLKQWGQKNDFFPVIRTVKYCCMWRRSTFDSFQVPISQLGDHVPFRIEIECFGQIRLHNASYWNILRSVLFTVYFHTLVKWRCEYNILLS